MQDPLTREQLKKKLAKIKGAGRNVMLMTAGFDGCTRMGGIKTAFTSLAYTLRDAGYNVTVLYLNAGLGMNCRGSNVVRMRQEGITLVPGVPGGRKTNDIRPLMLSFHLYEYLKSVQDTYPIIISHDFESKLMYVLLAQQQGLQFQHNKIIVWGHSHRRFVDKMNQRWPHRETMLAYFLEQETYRLARNTVSPSVWYQNKLYEQGYYNLDPNTEVDILQNIIYTQNPYVQEKEILHPAGLAFFSRLDKLKGIRVFMDAIDIIYNQRKTAFEAKRQAITAAKREAKQSGATVPAALRAAPSEEPLDVLFLGVDSDLSKMERSSTMIYNRCRRWSPHVWCYLNHTMDTQSAIEEITSSKSLIVLPTLADTFPYSVLESIYHGLPFVASRIGGIPEMLHPVSQEEHLFEAGNAEALAAKMSNVLNRGIEPAVPAYHFHDTALQWAKYIKKQFKSLDDEKGTKPVRSLVNLSTLSALHMDGLPVTVGITHMLERRSETYLRECLLAFANQTYMDFEVVIAINGGDQDKEYAKVIGEHFGTAFKRLSVFNSPVVNIDELRNFVVEKAQGDYVLMFDDDDVPYADMVESMLRAASNTDADVIACLSAHHRFTPASTRIATDGSLMDGVADKGGPLSTWQYDHIALAAGNVPSVGFTQNLFGQAAFFAKTAKFREIGGITMAGVKSNFVDWSFWLKASLRGLHIELVPEPLYKYRLKSRDSLYNDDSGSGHSRILKEMEYLYRDESPEARAKLLDMLVLGYAAQAGV
ncbi:hypothetical protein SARC_09736 [Sphaeroforma arctica JP610]|uniref:Glycosyltransferase 2-like domain-containing protein n=1 Tax=Sphaeroforma arctica JP610 TaxID=667725 RepID=A0A0L0FMS9_9EUKA|nr:hypothetical protein SARC_09736 [Sphaeroforma arctica JP610]KNC77816.1 hypothetical protein SARC_09736 [Sphaeroforma arctica JP610]|eukprot:XP_014151718.1 hypothetical protein SARC_09736 [Sphaeroforma arctica JP610]